MKIKGEYCSSTSRYDPLFIYASRSSEAAVPALLGWDPSPSAPLVPAAWGAGYLSDPTHLALRMSALVERLMFERV
jgi:hypothetical protein